MAKISINNEVITLIYQKEKNDPGKIEQAFFHICPESYCLCISADEYAYEYEWKPTPDTESFPHLLSRLNGEYLLDKLSSRTEVNPEETYVSILKTIKLHNTSHCLNYTVLKQICYTRNVDSLVDKLREYFKHTPLDFLTETDLRGIIEYDYSDHAKEIVQIFCQYIRPICKSIAEKE